MEKSSANVVKAAKDGDLKKVRFISCFLVSNLTVTVTSFSRYTCIV